MARELTLRVITPDAVVLDVRTGSVRIPGVDGSIGIWPRHAPMVAAVDSGLLHYSQGSSEQVLFVTNGFAEVRGDLVRVVCEAGEKPEEIDETRAKEAEKRARERLARRGKVAEGDPIDILRAEMALRRALMRQQVLGYASRLRGQRGP
jgi:F-type H+-transporting ATPase subunit epsilon